MTKELHVTRRTSFKHQNFLTTDFGMVVFEAGQEVLKVEMKYHDLFKRYLDVFSLKVVEVEDAIKPKKEKEVVAEPVVDEPVVETPAEPVVEDKPAEEVAPEVAPEPVVEAPVEAPAVEPVVEETPAAVEEAPADTSDEETVEETVTEPDGSSKVTRSKRKK
jgi:hypothetical protein